MKNRTDRKGALAPLPEIIDRLPSREELHRESWTDLQDFDRLGLHYMCDLDYYVEIVCAGDGLLIAARHDVNDNVARMLDYPHLLGADAEIETIMQAIEEKRRVVESFAE